MTRVLVTGATGFVGSALIERLRQSGVDVAATIRDTSRALRLPSGVPHFVLDLARADQLDPSALEGIDCIVHLAAQVHLLHPSAEQHADYLLKNAMATESLARCAVRAGVRRFVFLSSIKVNGERTISAPFRADDRPNAEDEYGRSKLVAERALQKVALETGLEVTIIRPPLVYGIGVRANFLRLLQIVDRRVPLPIASIRNARSMISVWNLCDLLERVINHPAACGVWLASDGRDLSTPEVITMLGQAMQRRLRLVACPVPLLKIMTSVIGMRAEFERLTSSLQVDVTETCQRLQWRPPLTVEEGFSRTVEWYLSSYANRAQ